LKKEFYPKLNYLNNTIMILIQVLFGIVYNIGLKLVIVILCLKHLFILLVYFLRSYFLCFIDLLENMNP